MKQNNLTKEELKEFIGGNIFQLQIAADDITNTNNVGGCICEYNNRPAITNNNTASNCSCVCWPR